MRSNFLKGFFIVSTFLIMFSATSAFAQESCRPGLTLRYTDLGEPYCACLSAACASGSTGGLGNSDSTGADGSSDSVGGTRDGALENPLKYKSISAVLLAILDVLVIFMIPIIILFIIYAGFLYVTARGNQSTIETAHRTLLYAVIGGLLILGARALLAVIQGTVNSLM